MQLARPLNEQQHEAVSHGDGPLLIIAGAGTGKTTVITERVKYLILEKKIPASNILALTFTEKSAKEMEERIDLVMPYGYTQMWISTFHSFCDRVLRNDAIHIGLDPSFKLMTEAQSVLFLRKNIFNLQLKYFRPLGNPYKFLEGLLQHFNRLADEDITPQEYLAFAQKVAGDPQVLKEEKEKNLELANAFASYEELKAKAGVMDFSDLISNTLKLFRQRKNVLQTYQQQFAYILVDEFQDTNFAQNTLAIMLAGDKKRITVVGDDDQAIYRWRGAAISNIIQFKKHFPRAKVITLTKNYRSTQVILDSAYDAIQHNNPDRLEVKEHINKKLISTRKLKGNPVEFFTADRVENEAEFVCSKIKQLLKTKKYAYSDFAILVRANDHAAAFTRSLSRLGIPYQFLGPGRLFRQEEIKDLIAYLKVLSNFEDSISLYRVLTMPIFAMQARDISAILNITKRKNYLLFEALEYISQLEIKDTFVTAETIIKIKELVAMIKRHLALIPKQTAGQILYYFIQDSGMLKQMITASNTENKQQENIAKFFDKLKTFETEYDDASVFAVVDWIDLSMQMGESPLVTDSDWSQNNAVNILTVHSSKGLEFSVVFLVNLVSQRFPTRQRREQIPIPQPLIKEILPEGDYHLQEERRLFYVGLTRAKDLLFLTAANFYGEGKRDRKISPFVFDALGKDSVEKAVKKQQMQKTIIQQSLLDWIPVASTTSEVSSEKTSITLLSYSQLNTFLICPLHYKLKYILKIPGQPTAAQSFGTSIHAALRDFYLCVKEGNSFKKEMILDILKKVWINDGYTSKEHEKEAFFRAQEILLSYLDLNLTKTPSPKPLAVEVPFQFFLSPINGGQPLKIIGRIDRVDHVDGNKIEVIDYKTGSNMLDEKDLEDDLQMTIYALAATRVQDKIFGRKPEEVILTIHYLEHNQIVTTKRTAEQLSLAAAAIFQKVDEIAQSQFICSGSTLCATCEYKMLCSTQL